MAEVNLMQTCGNCGTNNEANAIVCTSCEVVLSAYASPETPNIPTDQPVTTQVASGPASLPELPQPVPTPAALAPSAADWRDMFVTSRPVESEARPQPITPKPVSAAPTRAPKPAKSGRASVVPPPPPLPAATVKIDPSLPPSVATMRRRAGNYVPPPASATNSTTGSNQARTYRYNDPRWLLSSKPILVGLIVMLFSCLLFIITLAGGADDGIPAFLLFCLAPIGFMIVVVGLVRIRRNALKGDQDRTRPPFR